MKKLMFALLMALSLPALGEWKLIETDKDGNGIYFDPGTLERNGNIVRVWMMSDLPAINMVGRLSYRNQHEFDCQAPRHRIIRAESYATHMAHGKPLDTDNDPQDWGEYYPGARYEKDRKLLCAK